MSAHRASATMGTLILGVLAVLSPVGGAHLLCDLLGVMVKEREMCADSLAQLNVSAAIWLPEGCAGMWDNLSCWPPTLAGHTISLPCPEVLQLITGITGTVNRNCTESGWSSTFPPVDVACQYNINDTEYEDVQEYYMHLKTLYTVGYGTSLSSLFLALLLLLSFRRLRCTRNYIHMNLFSSFILRAMSIFIKDAVLFSIDDINHCKVYLTDCHYVMIFFQYCIMANYSWLLVEGLYLHTLLVVSFFSEWKYFCWYIALGWGSPLVFIIAWSVCRQLYENTGCWNINSNASVWWIIRGPVILSIFVQFEIQRKWRRYHLRKHFWLRQNKHSTVSNSGSVLTQVVQLSRSSQREARKSSTPMTSLI
ncbi:secretin receptor isoform X2 [Ranitomeya imitator]|uniref:secretin receptor isoform X2 n=1 Tax=Ranitomeya imitator TaxID=111125 RepID=UPI0037E71533